MRIFEFTINPDDLELGMSAISLVDKPAMESEFIAFQQQEKPKSFVTFTDEKKYIVAGLALIPNKLVYRVDAETEEEYFGFFSENTIEVIMNKFMLEATEGTTKKVNLQHSDYNVNAHLIESFILRTPEMVDAVIAMGIKDAVLGSWFVSYKFDSIEDYNTALESGMHGFSIEIMLQRELKLNKNNSNNKHMIMAKLKTFVDKFKTILSELESEETTFEDVVVPESGKSLRIGDVGTPVLWVSVDEAGVEMTEAVIGGEYVLEDGRVVVVDDMGNLAEIRPVEAPVEPIVPEDLETPVETPLAVDEDGNPLPEVEVPVEAPAAPNVASKTLGEIVDISTDGEYYIKVVVAGGAITEAVVEAEQNLIKAADFETVQTELETVKTELVETQEKLKAIKVKSTFTEFTTPPAKKVDTSKMNNLERKLHELGLAK